MPLITRQGKGSKLTIQEMDGNLTYLEELAQSYYNNSSSSINTDINWSNGKIQEIFIDNDPILTFTSGVLGQSTSLLLKQQLVGQRTISWPNEVVWNNSIAPTLQSIANIAPDNTFFTGSGFNDITRTVAIDSSKNLLIGGYFTSYNGTGSNYIISLDSSGSVNNNFNIGSGFDNTVQTITIQPDKKILVGGDFTEYDGNSVNYFARLNESGSIDNTFSIGSGFNNTVNDAVLQPDGKILLIGGFNQYDGNSSNCIVRLNNSGSIDNDFVIGSGFNYNTLAIAIQADGKILVGGEFTEYDGNSVNHIIRLDESGSIDNTFSIGSGFNTNVNSIAIQADGKILVGGDFTSYNGTTSNRLIRLDSDGSVDSSFNIGNGLSNPVFSITIQPDEKIIIGGYYPGPAIFRFNSDGTSDSTFNVGVGLNGGYVREIALQDDGKIVVVGAFSKYNNINSKNIVRLLEITPTDILYNIVNFVYNGINYIGYF